MVNFLAIERKWQKAWEKKKIFKVKENKKKKYFLIEMFPYPSSSGLHMGHALNYTIGDIYARFKRMNNFNVLYPMGFDALGLPAENAAIQAKSHPKPFTEKAIKNYTRQMKELGLSYDWSRIVITCYPEYYKWNQYFFLKFYEKGLVYRKKSAVNWCPKCQTVLANEQVHSGKCWRHENTDVEIKQLEQWFIKTTKYSEELLNDIKKLQWPERIKTMQENWIGKSYGTEIDFEINNNKLILVDAVHCLIDSEGNVNHELKRYLDSISNKKVVLTNAPKEKHKLLFKNIDYEVFTLENKPNKKEPDYYKTFLDKHKLKAEQVIYFEHDKESVESAESVGIKTLQYENDINSVKQFIESNLNKKWPIFTTRPDTIYGVTFMVISAQHPKLMEIVTTKQKSEVEKFLKKLKSVSEKELEEMEKEGVFTGSYAINPLTKEKIPVYAGNFVVADYGSGMVMAVPAHDQRDFEFAKKYNIPIKIVIQPKDKNLKHLERAYTEEGTLVNSDKFSGMYSKKAIEEITKYLEEKKLGKKSINYKLRDWLVSRQRYWGTPIPMIYCDKCGIIPVPEKDLPVLLPEKVKFGQGNPLSTNKKFTDVKCPKCKSKARRETDTMDTFFDSSWYFLRYCDNKNKKKPFDVKKVKYWMPVDQYIGGAEHACMHLIYARFFTKALRDLGLLNFDEPFTKLFNQGMLHGSDGEKMSKSRGNVVLPEEVSKKYGMDTARLFLMSQASPEKDTQWSENGIDGSLRIINKIISFFDSVKLGSSSPKVESKLNKTLKEFTEDIEGFRYNLGIIKLRLLFETFEQEKEISRKDLEAFLKMLHPICPHITEELWHKLKNKNFISLEKWPVADESKINTKLEEADKIIDKTVSDIVTVLNILKEKGIEGKTVYLYVIPNELQNFNAEILSKRINKEVKIFAVNDKNKYDPEGKSAKCKPGKPAIFIE